MKVVEIKVIFDSDSIEDTQKRFVIYFMDLELLV